MSGDALFSDDRLERYADNELSSLERERVRAEIAKDPNASSRVDDLQQQRQQIATAFRSVDYGDALQRLERTVDLAFERRATQSDQRGLSWSRFTQGITSAVWPRPSWPMAASATVVIFIAGLGAGYYASNSRIDQAVEAAIMLQKEDELLMADALVDGLENHQSGQLVEWANPQSGSFGSIVPIRTFKNGAGQWCREFDQVTHSGKGEDRRIGVACRQGAGTWTIKLEQPADAESNEA